MKTYVVYHKADLDGVFSAAAVMVAKNYGDTVTPVPYQYGEDIPDLDDPTYGKVFVCDVSFGKGTEWAFRRWAEQGKEVVWIDHHKSAIESIKAPIEVGGVREVGTAACLLTWKYLGMRNNKILSLLSAYDVWDHDKYNWEDVEAFQFGMRARVGLSVGWAYRLLNDYIMSSNKGKSEMIDELIKEGRVIINFESERNKGDLEMFSFEATVLGKRALCMNTTTFSSKVFENMWDENEFDVMMPFCWNGDMARCSFYTTKDDVDCSEMARKLGGGGHRQAAGFQMPLDKFVRFLADKEI